VKDDGTSRSVRKQQLRAPAPRHNGASTFEEKWRMAGELHKAGVPIFTLTEEERVRIVDHMRVRTFDKGEVVYHLGDSGQDLFVVYDGLVMCWLEDEDDHHALLSWFGPGQFVGEFDLIRPGRLHTVTAVEATTALQIQHEDAIWALRENRDALWWVAERMHDLHRRLRDAVFVLAFGTAESRVADVLLEADVLRERLGHSLTQEQLAAAAFMTDRYLRTVLDDFEARGLIETRGRRIHICGRARLRAEIRRPNADPTARAPSARLGDVTLRDN
jgi:CRP/FNR family transcriptional regulator, cyclic AMP receptor protein